MEKQCRWGYDDKRIKELFKEIKMWGSNETENIYFYVVPTEDVLLNGTYRIMRAFIAKRYFVNKNDKGIGILPISHKLSGFKPLLEKAFFIKNEDIISINAITSSLIKLEHFEIRIQYKENKKAKTIKFTTRNEAFEIQRQKESVEKFIEYVRGMK